ncbi:hypothetical protein GLOIN_2v1488187 [Rhizophagus clarus]|uniref:Uncharacterized protein n=1 Tax=Rhizophagus clarus TaxID=94130 RepID=A0A8H3L4E5_9GLOM|nr:hypothetical protein GLOIN_2v1488187 [Rhizophagus clarus]
MGEKTDNRFRETLHGTRNRNSVRSRRQNGDLVSRSSDIGYNSVGRDLPIMVLLRDESTSSFREEKLPSPKSFSSRETGSPVRQDDFDGTRYEGSPDHNKNNYINKKITKEEQTTRSENKDNKLYVRSVSPYWEDRQDTSKARAKRNEKDSIPKQQIGSGIEDENNQSIEGMSFGCCPNREKIMQASLGKLCRGDGLNSTPWTQVPKKPCKLILPDDDDRDPADDQTSMSHVRMDNEDDEALGLINNPRNSLMLVEMIACESDICRVSSSIGFKIKTKVPLEDLIVYIKRVKEYGFNHIIIIGELYCGMFFLDCYCRLFEWDHMQYLLFPLGDYLKKDFQINPAVVWDAVDEFVFEIKIKEVIKYYSITKDPITDVGDGFLTFFEQ